MHFLLFLTSLIFGWGASTNTCQNPIILPSEGPTVCMPLDQYEKRSIGTKGEKGENGTDGQKGETGLVGPKGQKGDWGGVMEGRLLLNESCSCSCIYERNNLAQSGIYDVLLPNSTRTIRVYCDMDTEGGGWTVFQRRQDGSVDFYREWDYYKRGFGNIGVEFWLGLDYLHELLSLSENELRVDLGDGKGNRSYAKYSTFNVGDESTEYVLSVSGYSGNAGDSLPINYHNGKKFTTKDQDNDLDASNCAITWHGAWWYDNCYYSNLNGGYYRTGGDGIRWSSWKTEPLKFSEMKFRSK